MTATDDACFRARTARLRSWMAELTVEQLCRELDLAQWHLAVSLQGIDDSVPGADAAAILDKSAVAIIVAEIDRRARARHRPEAPAWDAGPDNGSLVALARDLRERIDLPTFAADHLHLDVQQRGRRSWTRCPAGTHADATPSCVLDPLRWHCFGCGRGGDVFDLALETGRAHTLAAAVALVSASTGEPAGERMSS